MDWNSIYWPGGLPLWLIALLAVILAESLRRRIPFLRERLSPACAYFLLGLRGLLYAAILFFLSGPTLLEERERVLPQRLLVLVDGSASMGLKDGGRRPLAPCRGGGCPFEKGRARPNERPPRAPLGSL